MSVATHLRENTAWHSDSICDQSLQVMSIQNLSDLVHVDLHIAVLVSPLGECQLIAQS